MQTVLDAFCPKKEACKIEFLQKTVYLSLGIGTSIDWERCLGAVVDLQGVRARGCMSHLTYHTNNLKMLYTLYSRWSFNLKKKFSSSQLKIKIKWKNMLPYKNKIDGNSFSIISSDHCMIYQSACLVTEISLRPQRMLPIDNENSQMTTTNCGRLLRGVTSIFPNITNMVYKISTLHQRSKLKIHATPLNNMTLLFLTFESHDDVPTHVIRDHMKDAMVAKLCQQLEEMYGDAHKQMNRESLKPLWDRDWLAKVAGKQAGYLALAQYHQSRVCNANKAVGEEIARLKQAIEQFKAAQVRSGDMTAFADSLGRAERALQDAEKDNNFIYHERIPDVKSLPIINKAAVAKSTPMPERFSSSFTDLFESLVPVNVQQALVQYDVRKQELVNSEIGNLRDSTQLLNSILASLNLPAAIEDVGGEKLPPSLAEKSTAVFESGGIDAIRKMMEELPELLTRNRELLDECQRQLKEEKDSDDQLRAQFKERWSRTPSEKLTSTFQTNAQKYKTVLDTAIQADSTIREKYDAHREGMELLSGGPNALASALPSAGAASTNGSNPAISQLRTLMESVETLKAERDAIESELKSVTVDMKEVFLSALASDAAINEPVMSIESLGRAFGPLQKQVKESIERQESLVSDIQTAHAAFSQASSGAGGERETMLKKLAAANDGYHELLKNLTEGTKFYNDLTQLLVTFQTKINDYCFARRTEKEELMKDLTSGLANQNVGSAPAPPQHHVDASSQGSAKTAPPRPPPPQQNPYQGAPQMAAGAPPMQTAPAGAPPAASPYAGAPPAYGAPQQPQLPYPVNPVGMPVPAGAPQGYMYQTPVYTPMPQGYNPYFQQPPQQGAISTTTIWSAAVSSTAISSTTVA
ncbi:unnamed protein product [Meganyctiphanes norvegica]|uniref:BRO1 domain-containing protein n=1 Tax=Meganyctiphanes norvegica TaxID=48144 RepID=A0AAV2PQG3_MEGNR